jgi:L-2,4-diaminobutyric acid acetyltransferase
MLIEKTSVLKQKPAHGEMLRTAKAKDVKVIDRKICKLDSITFRTPEVGDGTEIWRLVRELDALELNSAYSYLMFCKFFPKTCVIAELDGEVAGFVFAFRPQTASDTVFVWQVGVDNTLRGRGVGIALLHTLLVREECRDVRFLEATVTPSNMPSQALFRKLARRLDTQCHVSPCFSSDQFPGNEHEDELLFRIGPFESIGKRRSNQ